MDKFKKIIIAVLIAIIAYEIVDTVICICYSAYVSASEYTPIYGIGRLIAN